MKLNRFRELHLPLEGPKKILKKNQLCQKFPTIWTRWGNKGESGKVNWTSLLAFFCDAIHDHDHTRKIKNHFYFKVIALEASIEQYSFSTIDNVRLYKIKKEILSQIRRFPIKITARNFMVIDRHFYGGVSNVNILVVE